MSLPSVREAVSEDSGPIDLRAKLESEDTHSLREFLLRQSRAVIWRGFDHEWEYNHRVNRLGSYVRPAGESEGDGGGWIVGHSAASGSGPDTAAVADYYTEITASGVHATTGTATISLSTPDTEATTHMETVVVALPESMRNLDNYAVVLNGFDLVSTGDADKLMAFQITTGRPEGRGGLPSTVEESHLEFPLDVVLQGDCSTPECTDDQVTYSLEVHYLVLGGNSSDFRTEVGAAVYNEYTWDAPRKRFEIYRRDVGTEHVSVDRADGWNWPGHRGTLGFTSFSMRLEKTGGHFATSGGEAVHLLRLALAIRNLSQQADTVEADVDLFFKNWTWGMKSAHIPHSEFSLKDEGRASFQASMIGLQFADAVEYSEDARTTSIQWDADQPSSSDAALSEERIDGS